MTSRTTAKTRGNLYEAVFDSAQGLIRTLPTISPTISPIDVAVAYAAVALALLCDTKVVDRETGRQTLVDALAQFDASIGDPEAMTH